MTRRSPRVVLALLLTALVVAVVGGPGAAPGTAAPAGDRPVFTPLATPDLGPSARVHPEEFRAFRVDLPALGARLAAAPTTRGVRAGAAPLTLTLPDPSGRPATFRVQATSVLEAGLAARHPELRTWAGVGVTDPTATIRLDLTPMGFHASVLGSRGAWYVDPAANRRGTTTHLVYTRSALPAPQRPLVEAGPLPAADSGPAAAPAATAPGALVQRRTFRLALVTDPTYAAYFGSANVLAEKVTLVNRVNQVYNDDLAIRLVLVDGTEALNLDTAAKASGPDGPCGANPCYDAADLAPATGGCSSALLDRTSFVIGQIIGADRYDVGHIGLGINGGGIAGLGVVGTSDKAAGCTGLPTPEGDFYAVDYVAHEIGHQFGGNHTFDGNQVNCSSGNRNPGTSVEPGSGSSVMAYAGICGRDDLQPHSDPYFSQRSIDEITATVDAAPGSYDEQQVVNLRGFDTAGETYQLTYPGATPVTITRGVDDTTVGLTLAIQQLTGELPLVSGYDGGLAPSDDGFTVDFTGLASGVPIERLGVVGAGDVTGFVGTIVDGGPGTNGGTTAATGNHAPAVTAPADRTIPVRTPFALSATGTDADAGQSLVYLWEQDDEGRPLVNGGQPLLANAKAGGPLFRVFGTAAQVSDEGALQSPAPGINLATADPSRTFPDLAQVLAGNTNAATGSCPAPPAAPAPVPAATVDCYSEYLPTSAYGGQLGGSLTFRVTARDRAADGGGTAHDDVTLTLDSAAGPFLVTSQATAGGTVAGGSTLPVTWDVNGTDATGLAPQVRIVLSTDGGLTWPTVLAATTPNDGSEQVTVPGLPTTHARLRVEAVGNYFFDVNDAEFEITGPLDTEAPDTSITSGPAEGEFVLTTDVDAGWSATEPGGQATCTLDGAPLPCSGGSVTLAGLTTGPHVLSVAARDAAGNEDPTPAVRRFVSPLDDDELTRSAGWTRKTAAAAYRGDYVQTRKAGESLRTRASGVRRVALVVSRAPGSGRVTVLLAGKRIGVVDLDGARQRRVLVVVRTFATPRSGKLRVVARGDGPVRIEGLGLG